jgi:uncharacterized protein
MANIGKFNSLSVVRKLDFGFYLDGGAEGDILIPLRYAPESCKVGDKLDVFIYFDSEDRIIATTETPIAIVGEFAYLQAVAVNSIGAFLDWGLPKDLLVPFREQKQPMEEGKSYIVFIYIDAETNRIAASAKLGQFLNHEPANYLPGDLVDIMIIGESDLGYKAAINNRHEGIFYKNEVFKPLKKGQKLKAYIRKVREDGKIDLRLYKDGYEKVDELSKSILEILRIHDGFIEITDKSPADEIYTIFGMSKKTFKKAAGALFKAKLIHIGEIGISMIINPE